MHCSRSIHVPSQRAFLSWNVPRGYEVDWVAVKLDWHDGFYSLSTAELNSTWTVNKRHSTLMWRDYKYTERRGGGNEDMKNGIWLVCVQQGDLQGNQAEECSFKMLERERENVHSVFINTISPENSLLDFMDRWTSKATPDTSTCSNQRKIIALKFKYECC